MTNSEAKREAEKAFNILIWCKPSLSVVKPKEIKKLYKSITKFKIL